MSEPERGPRHHCHPDRIQVDEGKELVHIPVTPPWGGLILTSVVEAKLIESGALEEEVRSRFGIRAAESALGVYPRFTEAAVISQVIVSSKEHEALCEVSSAKFD